MIVLVSAFFRFYKIGDWFTFNFDEEYQTLLAWEQVKNFHPIWIGVSASNVGFYLGPGFTYLTALLLSITSDPIILAYFASGFGVITTLSVYWISRRLFDKTSALFAGLFYAASVFVAYFDRRFWNPTPIAFISVWLFYSLVRAPKQPRWLIVTAILLATALHVHLSLLAFWPIAVVVVWQTRKKINPANWLMMVGGYLLVVSPLIVFDLVHRFDNLLMPVRFVAKFFTSNRGAGNLVGNLPALEKVVSNFFFLKLHTNIQDEFGLGIHGQTSPGYPALIALGAVVFVWLIWQSRHNKTIRLLTISLSLFALAFLTYSAGTVQYFLLGFVALFTMALGRFFRQLPRPLAIVAVIVFVLANTTVLATTTQTQYGLTARKNLIKKMLPYFSDKTFYLTTLSPDKRPYHSSGGWRYLFKAYGKTPSASSADQFFGWIYPDEISRAKPEINVVVSEYPAERLPGRPTAIFQSGVYYGYIVQN